MATVISQLGTGFEDVSALVQELSQAADASIATAEKLAQALKGENEQIPQLGKQVRSGLDEFAGMLERNAKNVEQLSQEVSQAVSALVQSSEQQMDQLAHSHQESHQQATAAHQVGMALGPAMQASNEGLTGQFQQLASLMGELKTATEQALQQAQSGFDSFSKTTAQCGQQFGNQATQVSSSAQTFKAGLADVGTAAGQAHSATSQNLKEEVVPKVVAIFVDQGKNIVGFLGDFKSKSQDQATVLQGHATDVVGTCAREFCENLPGQVTQEVQNSATQAVEDLAQSFVESASSAALGATVSGTLAPFLPEILAVKKILDVINSVL